MRSLLPEKLRRALLITKMRATRWPPVGWVNFGGLRRTTPISRAFGIDRGQCIDRYYIEHFLSEHQADIYGHVLEIGDNNYTRRFGGERVARSDVLHARPGNPRATIVGDLALASALSAETFDCIILTQTLQFIYDTHAAIQTLHRILRTGGVALVTIPGITQISRFDMDRWGEYWRFTSLSAKRLFEPVFTDQALEIAAHGNVLAASALLYGLAAHELRPHELNDHDPDYQIVITIRARKL